MKKKLEKLLCLFLCTILLCSIFSGCSNSNQENENSTAQAYLDMAQEYIADGNYTSAIDVLKKGYSSTGDERINALLQDLLASQATSPTTNATDPPVTEPSLTEPPATEPPVIAPPSSPTFLYTHSGTISISSSNISLQDSAILYVTLSYAGNVSYTCEPSNIVTLTWGEFDYTNTAPLYITASQNGTANIRIYETEYPNNYLTVNVTVSNHTAYDTSKASGILASMGMTEEQFRNNCIFLTESIKTDNNYREIYPHISIEEIKAYPGNYIGMFFAIEPKAYRIEHILSGTRDRTAIEVLGKGTTSDGYYYYGATVYDDSNTLSVWEMLDMKITIIDMRDDVYTPNISEGDKIIPYMIFIGLQNDIPTFQMISVDVNWK